MFSYEHDYRDLVGKTMIESVLCIKAEYPNNENTLKNSEK